MLILVGRTGNNTNVVLAVALCASEDEENCRWFIANAKAAGLVVNDVPIFSDRGSGLLAAIDNCEFGCFGRYCTRHIVGNFLKKFNGCVPVDLKTMVYRIQGADTEEEFKSHVASLRLTHPLIADYIQEIPKEKWLMYPSSVRNIKMYGWRTTNFVESANGASVPARGMFPLHFFKEYMDKFMTEAFD
ncbi:hypothetical protein AeRB84_013416 [Aphanomyces euteiches]|nr:hypothetical protein AeRB84_013416 [Aphanomyces euteiches]